MQCARARKSVDLNGRSRAPTGHQNLVSRTQRTFGFFCFAREKKLARSCHELMETRPNLGERNLSPKANQSTVTAENEQTRRSPPWRRHLSPACGSRAPRRLATLSLCWVRLYFARENPALRIDLGNPRASDFGLRPKVTKGRFRCASRENVLLLARAVSRCVLPNSGAPARWCKQHGHTESVHCNGQSVCCLFNTPMQCARARKSVELNS